MKAIEAMRIVGGISFNINPDVIINVYIKSDDRDEIYNDFIKMTPMEQRAHLNAILFDRLSK